MVEISFDAGSTWTDLGVVAGDPVNWSYNFAVTGANDGDYSYQVRATDSSGGKTTLDRQVVVDATAPTVSFEQPAALAVVNGTDVTVQGTTFDNRGVSSVLIHVDPEFTPPPADRGLWSAVTGLYSWSYSLDSTAFNNTDTPANYVISIVAEDAAGNESSIYQRTVSIDQSSDRPVISFNGLDKTETDDTANVLADPTTLTGTIEDDDLIDPALFSGDSIEISLDGGAWTAVSTLPASSGKVVVWKHDISALSEGLHDVKVRVRDNQSDGTVGASSVSAEYGSNFNWGIEDSSDQNGIPFNLNLGAPALVLTSPAMGSSHNSNVTIDGTATDANRVDTVEISFDSGSTWTDLGVTPGNPVNWSYTYTVASDGSTDGTKNYIIRATDRYGSASMENSQFTVDATAPTVSFEQPSALAVVNGTAVTVQGTANDNRGIAAVYIDVHLSSGSAPANLVDWDTVTGLYSWNYSFDSTGLNNTDTPDDYVISVIAVDTAGNESIEYTRTVSIDQGSDRPVIDFNDIDKDETDPANNVLVGATTLTGIIEDDDLIDPSLFGGDAIEISFDGGCLDGYRPDNRLQRKNCCVET